MSIKAVLLGLAEQMYEDIRFITQHNPTQVVDEDTARMFNSLLGETRINCPGVMAVVRFEEMSARTLKYKDALVVVGQLRTMLRMASETDVDQIARESMRRVLENESLDESLDEEDPKPVAIKADDESERFVHDPELYGESPVPMNPDGTVPFGLDDEGKAADTPGAPGNPARKSLRDESEPDFSHPTRRIEPRIQQNIPLQNQ